MRTIKISTLKIGFEKNKIIALNPAGIAREFFSNIDYIATWNELTPEKQLIILAFLQKILIEVKD